MDEQLNIYHLLSKHIFFVFFQAISYHSNILTGETEIIKTQLFHEMFLKCRVNIFKTS